MFSVCNISPHK